MVVAAVGLVRLSVYGYNGWRRSRLAKMATTTAAPVIPWDNPPAPRTPPKTPLPGRPFSEMGVVYRTSTPSAESLRAAVADTNVVICVLDAARADRFGAYGYPRPTTPNFDRLAQRALLFDQHFCVASHTGPSTISLLTSQHPDTHGLLTNYSSDGTDFRSPSPSTFTLERALQGIGYHTFMFSGNVAASPELGIGGDFMFVGDSGRGGANLSGHPIAFMTESFAEVPAKLKDKTDRRFFAYLHVLPPHEPYRAPKPIADLFAKTRPPLYWEGKSEFPEARADRVHTQEPDSWVSWGNDYDANLRYADTFLAELEKALKQMGAWERTLLIVTADHGEALREHGYTFHAGVPYDEALHIPLLIRFPGPDPPVGRVKALTQTIDLLPTLLELYGAPYPRDQVQGKSLLPLLTGRVKGVNDYLFARATDRRTACYIIRDARSTLLLYRGGKRRALYDMDADPYQTHNLNSEQPARAEKLVKAFEEFARKQRLKPLDFVDPNFVPPTATDLPTQKMSEETKRKLKSLGYLK
jgi:arylsulfatase A-like enzyme